MPLLTLFLRICCLLFVAGVFVVGEGLNDNPRARLVAVVQGTAHKPFVYRALVPTCVRISAACIPAAAENWLRQQRVIQAIFSRTRLDIQYPAIGVCAIAVCLCGFALFMLAMYRLGAPPSLALLGILPFFQYASYLYDVGTLCCFAWGLYFLHTQRRKLYLWVFVLACFNKETALLLTLTDIAIHWQKNHIRAIWQLLRSQQVGIQLLLYFAIKLCLWGIFRENAGYTQEWTVSHNVFLLHSWLFMRYIVVAVPMGIALIAYRWQAKPQWLKRSLWILPPLVVFAFFFGYMDEFRIYYEAYPAVFLLILHPFMQQTRV